MKSFVAAILVALLLIGGSIGYGIYINNTARMIEEKTGDIESLIKSGDFDGAKGELSMFYEMIEKENTLLGSIIEHKEVFEIKRNIYEIGVFLDSKNSEESLSRLEAILSISEQLSGNSSLKIRNIL